MDELGTRIYSNEAGTIQVDYTRRTGYYTMTDQHTHDGYELYYLFSGERDYFIRDRTYRVEQGSFVFIERGELHRTVDTGVPNHERVVFNIADSLLENFPSVGHNGVIRLSPQEHWKGESLARELIEEARGRAFGRELMLEAILKQLLLLVFRAQAERKAEAASPTATHQIMSEIAAYVGANYQETLLLREVADQFYISPYYLSRKFKACTGFGFAEYVQIVRIREAQRMLRETDWKMIYIAEQTGIGPAASFHKLFKKLSGCSPLQYRKRHQRLLGSSGTAHR